MEREDLASKFHLLSYLLLPVPFGGCRSKHGEGGVWPQSQLLLPVGGRPAWGEEGCQFQYLFYICLLFFGVCLILDLQWLLPVHYGFCPLVKFANKDLAKLSGLAAIFKTKSYFR